MKFRSDINGLRGWAVILVLLFHYEILNFYGGFIGVDIFFVISGFLMTYIISNSYEANTFTISNFYSRRAKRIIPALIILIIFVLVLGFLILPPNELLQLSKHAGSSALFLSNFTYMDEAGYFDTISSNKWLLHTWSISVEWQFYLIYPLILKVIFAITPKHKQTYWHLLFHILAFVSLYYFSIKSSVIKEEFGFFMLPARAWELIAGSIAFYLFNLKVFRSNIKFLSDICILLLILSSLLISDAYRWPSSYTLIPVFLTFIIILNNAKNSLLLGNKMLQFFGNISYSLFLWHWPIFVALNFFFLDTFLWKLLGILISITLAFISYNSVELKFNKLKTSRSLNIFLISIVILVSLISFKISQSSGYSWRFNEDVLIASNEAKNKYDLQRSKNCIMDDAFKFKVCTFGNYKKEGLILYGDSHASSIISALSQATNTNIIYFINQCPVIFDSRLKSKTSSKKCKIFHNQFKEYIKIKNDLPILIVSRFAAQLYGPNESKTKNYGLIYNTIFAGEVDLSDEMLYLKRLNKTFCEISSNASLYVMEPIPEIGFDVPSKLSRKIYLNKDIDIGIGLSAYTNRNIKILREIEKAKNHCNVKILRTTDHLCKNNFCNANEGVQPLYFDDDHLSETGNRKLIKLFKEIELNYQD
jgi:peptidoglycan/LPS O-acetylase OafA/YrhL